MKSQKILSPAKINVYLEVLRKRDDGFHDIDSVMLAVNLFDEITVNLEHKDSGESSFTLNCEFENLDSTDFPCDKRNLIVKASKLFLETQNVLANVTIYLYKRIPWGAGLGGGSSNAASVIKVLASLISSKLSALELAEIGAQIGSDVPFFMFLPSARCRGRGEIVNKFFINQKLYIVIIFPPVHCSTANIYKQTNLTLKRHDFSNIIVKNLSSPEKVNFSNMSKLFFNRLEASAIMQEGKLQEVYDKSDLLKTLFWERQLSGSGSAVIFYTDEKQQSQLAKSLQSLNIGHVFIAETILTVPKMSKLGKGGGCDY